MMEFTLLTFAAMALVVVVTPGPTVLLALSNGTRFGMLRAGYGIIGAALSDAVLIAAAGVGLGSVLTASAFWFSVVKWVGVAYLVWIGSQMLRSSGLVATNAAPGWARGGQLEILRKSFVVAVMNPKGLLFFAAFFPQFLDVGAPILAQYVTLGVIFIATDVAVMAAYAALGSKAMHYLNARGACWMDRLCGGVLVVMAGALTLVRRGEV
ncbi:LysE family translocator [Shimia aestuarii]|uniref:Threonine/homoserine/homoserine lactone efflux protein n=1 Tax=Shimia aestuarii TaxID=254406 RepID=A0A1I4JUQ7_9RHOB|nr:LysE family translocator [Shimia aestuarii]SFL70270.1 Threonine/homoserine/homoserine lactone efflux protein [Shimia aestuarii]